MSLGHWANAADRVLKELYKLGQPAPTREEVSAAYPFGERRYWPYKVWLARCKAWRLMHAKGLAGEPPHQRPPAKSTTDGVTGDLFE